MQIFYAPGIDGNEYILDEKESKHCIRSLRMRKGDLVKIIDGKGTLYEGVISKPDPRACKIEISGIEKDFEKRNYSLDIAISPLKNSERFEWFVEKSVEMGLDRIIPLLCHNTEKPSLKEERIENVIISAMKQSLQALKTNLEETIDFDKLLKHPFEGVKMIAHCNGSFERRKISDVLDPGENALILIGPEGDFTYNEIKLAVASGFESVHLGKSRLRSETAGVAACHSVYFINQ
jgi:16S rRNA (uracil1498-N3)-methyltransferase